MSDLFYFLMLAFLIAHELDAVKRHEWRVLPLTAFLPERTGEQVFIWAHVPIFVLLFSYGGFNPSSLTAICLSAFGVIHLALHIGFVKHPKYEFNNLSSWALIIATAVFGAAHLLASKL